MKTVYFYGDSNTDGYDPRGMFGGRYPDDACWTSIVQKKLSGSWLCTADGMNGREIPRRTSVAAELLAKRLADFPDLTLFAVMLGTNDVLDMGVPDADRICRRMEDFLSWLSGYFRAAGSATRTAVVIPPPIKISEPGGSTFTKAMEDLQELYRRLAAHEKILCIDSDAWGLDLAFDGVHLSEEGHRQFAEGMVRALEDMTE